MRLYVKNRIRADFDLVIYCMVKNDCLEEQSLFNKNSQFARQFSMLSRLALLWSCLAGARYYKRIQKAMEMDWRAHTIAQWKLFCWTEELHYDALCNCEILPSLVRCCQIVSGFVKSCQIASGHVSVFDCFLLWLCLAVCWLFFVVKTKAKALPVLLKNVRLDVAMWNLEARLQKRGGIGFGGMLKAESCVVLTSHEKMMNMSLPKVRTIMHLDSFENFTFQLWPMHLAQSSLFNLCSPSGVEHAIELE